MTSPDSTDEQDTFLTCVHLNDRLRKLVEKKLLLRFTREHSKVIYTILTHILLIRGTQ